MASTHKSLRSSTANKRPTTAIADGQIALNTNSASPGLFFKDSTGATVIKIGPVHVGTTAPNASPAAGGSAGNSTGEIWLDTSLTPVGVKIWNGSAFINATPIGSTTIQGLLELATSAETQAGSDTDRAVTPAGLQSKVSDSTSTTSSTTIASSTAVKSAYDLANAALPKSGGTVTGNLEIGTTGSLSFEGSTADAFETTLAVVDPTADRTITLPNTTGTVVTTGDTGTVTSTMILDGTIVDGDINASAAIALSKLATGALPTAITVASANIVDGTIVNADVNASAAIAGTKISPDFGSQNTTTTGTNTAASFIPSSSTVPTNGLYLPAANSVALATGGSQRLVINSSGQVSTGAGISSAGGLNVSGSGWGVLPYVANSLVADSTAGQTRLFATGTDASTHGNLLFFTGTTNGTASERMRLTSTGLGIGNSSPSYLVDASGSATIGIRYKSTGSYGIIIADNGSATGGGSFSAYQNGTQKAVFGVVGAITGTTSSDTALFAETGQGLQFFTNGAVATPKAVITSGGNVGINITSPSDTLHVSGNARFDGGTSPYIKFYNGATRLGFVGPSGGDMYVSTDSGNLILQTANTERARLDSSGRLLVGTSSDSGGALLQVNGDRVRIATAKTPASAAATGTTGEVCWDSGYIYVCTATNTWKRAALNTW